MGLITKFGIDGNEQLGDPSKGAALVALVPRGIGYAVSGMTGTIAAALAANSPVFAMRLDPGSLVNAYIDRLRLQYTTLVAYTTPLTAGRRLAIYRGSGAATSGGTAIATSARKDTTLASSEMDTVNGGDIRIASTGALTATGITWEAEPIATMSLSHVGAAGNFIETLFEFAAGESSEIILQPGQILGIRNPVAMDAAGTWQLAVNAQWRENKAYLL